jgi:trimethylamine:corrinoid methyltransferase-like protein
MVELVQEGRTPEELRDKPRIAGYIDPTSPFAYGKGMLEALMEYASHGQAISLTVMAFARTIGPS